MTSPTGSAQSLLQSNVILIEFDEFGAVARFFRFFRNDGRLYHRFSHLMNDIRNQASLVA